MPDATGRPAPASARVFPGTDFPRAVGSPAFRALTAAGFGCVADLAGASPAALLRLHGVGPRAIRILAEALAARGLAFASGDQSDAAGGPQAG